MLQFSSRVYVYIIYLHSLRSFGSSDWDEVCQVMPWSMMISPPPAESSSSSSSGNSFAIPISLGANRIEGKVKVMVYVDKMENVPVTEELDGYPRTHASTHILALNFTTEAVSSTSINVDNTNAPDGNAMALSTGVEGEGGDFEFGGVLEDGFNATDNDDINAMQSPPVLTVVTSIKIAFDYDELNALIGEGYELICTQVTDKGAQDDNEQVWKFHILTLSSILPTSHPLHPLSSTANGIEGAKEGEGKEGGDAGDDEQKVVSEGVDPTHTHGVVGIEDIVWIKVGFTMMLYNMYDISYA